MNQQNKYFKLGLFVIVGVLLLVTAVVILGAGALFADYLIVETAVSESIQGLDVGAAVDFKGVKIGRVKRIRLAGDLYKAKTTEERLAIGRYVLIDMEISRTIFPEDDTSLDERITFAREHGLRVRMAQAGITGPSYLEVLYVDPVTFPEPKLPFTPKELYVPSTPSFVETITSGVERLALELREMKLAEITQNANGLITDMRTSLSDLQLKKVGDNAIATLDQSRASVQRIRELLSSPDTDRLLKDAAAAATGAKDTLQNPDLKTFLADLPKISANLRQTTEQIDKLVHDPAIKKAMDSMSETAAATTPAAIELRRTLRELNTLLGSQRRDLELLIAAMRRASENAADLSEDAKNNPSRMFFGAPPPHTEPK